MNTESPKFILYTGPMFSGKTSKMLLVLERFKHQRKRILTFKPALDDRYSDCKIITHGGWERQALCIDEGNDILKTIAEVPHTPHVVAVDEAFMIKGVADVLIWLFTNGINVVVSTIEMSATVKPFGEVTKLFPYATHVEKCYAVCTVCGCDASHTHKKQVGGEEIQVGGNELYEPRCYEHHPLINHRPTPMPTKDAKDEPDEDDDE